MIRNKLIVLAVLLASLASSTAWAHGRARVGVFIGVPLVSSYHFHSRPYYSYSYSYSYSPYPYYYPVVPVVVTPPAPPVYIEQSHPQTALPPNYWYYCQNPQGYYPYVKECAGGWQQVSPQPPTRP